MNYCYRFKFEAFATKQIGKNLYTYTYYIQNNEIYNILTLQLLLYNADI